MGCDATNDKAIEKIFQLKGRENNKPLISLVANKNQLRDITGLIPDIDITSKPTTVIYPKATGISNKALAQNKSAAIRIVNDEFCKSLIHTFKKPIISTSANISNHKSPNNFSEISIEIKQNVDYIVDLYHKKLMTNPSEILLLNKDGSITNIRS